MLRKALIATTLAASLMLGFSPGAQASSSLEAVWSFNGGKVAIEEGAGGTFRGVVVAPTKFAQCYHPVGQEMWTQIREQADGSFWGLHQWYFETAECVPNPQLGLTAWRVLTAANGSKVLKVCFSEPGSKSQPMISPSGAFSGATYGCNLSARLSALPSVTPADAPKYILLPGNGLCLTRSVLRIRLRDPSGDPIVKARMALRSGKVMRRAKLIDKSNGMIAILNLRGLPRRSFRVMVEVTTALGHHLRRQHTYRICGPTRARGHRHHKHPG
jgi:hypothetical protein